MSPSFSTQNLINKVSFYFKELDNFAWPNAFNKVEFLNSKNLFFRNNRSVMACPSNPLLGIFSFSFCLATFSRFVGHVIGACPKKKMIWVGAFRIVAFVTNKKIAGNFSIMDDPRNPVGAGVGLIFSDPKLPITKLGFSRIPFPASSKLRATAWKFSVFGDFLKKPLLKSFESLAIVIHKQKPSRQEKVLSAHDEPQSQGRMENVLSSAFLGHNIANLNIFQIAEGSI